MRITFELPMAAEAALQAAAQKQGVAPTDLAAQVLLSYLAFLSATSLEPVEGDSINSSALDAYEKGKELALYSPAPPNLEMRLRAIREFTEEAQNNSGHLPPFEGQWSREEIYEGTTEHLLGNSEAANVLPA